MKYQLKVYYRTPLMDKLTGYMQQIMSDWKDKHLRGCQTFEFETVPPLSDEEKANLKALKEDWMDEIEIEEVG